MFPGVVRCWAGERVRDHYDSPYPSRSRRFPRPSSLPSELPRPSQALRENTLPSDGCDNEQSRLIVPEAGRMSARPRYASYFAGRWLRCTMPHSAMLGDCIDLTYSVDDWS